MELRVQEGGTVFDLSASGPLGVPNAVTFYFRQPDGVIITRTPSPLVYDGANGILRWTTTTAADFAQLGRWEVQARLGWATGENFGTSIASFLVEETLW